MRHLWTLTSVLAMTAAVTGCPTEEEEENFPAEMCEVMAEATTTDLTADADMAASPELSITEGHDSGVVNVVTGLSDAEATYVTFTPDEDGELVLFADAADVVVGLFEDGAAGTLPEGGPNDECAAEIPEHWHLEDLVGGTQYALELGPTALTELHLVIAHHEGGHDEHE